MTAIVTATAAVGLLASYVLLHMGVTRMDVRYPVAVAVAYAAFLGLVAVWLRRYRLRTREANELGPNEINLDIADIPLEVLWHESTSGDTHAVGGGGGLSGAGEPASWIGSAPNAPMAHPPVVSQTSAISDMGGAGNFDLEEGALWLLPLAIMVVLALGVLLYVVYIAPALLAELLIDAGLAAGLYRRLAKDERRSWLTTAIRNTVMPACFVAVLLSVSGFVMQAVYPDTVSIGGVARHIGGSTDQQHNDR
jgi:hypothetical protein